MTKARVRAPAKINLTLHVTGQRDDGYHLLDSLVVFAPVHDLLEVGFSARGMTLSVSGPEAAGVPCDDSNLVLRAARLVCDDISVKLTKFLPAASGIGGGSADAAAVLRALLLRGLSLDEDQLGARLSHLAAALDLQKLGADLPMCMMNRPLRATGIGETLTPVPDLPPLPAVLVNPRKPVSTPAVFRAMTRRDNPPMPAHLPRFADAADLVAFLQTQRNDMQPAAEGIEPAVGQVLDALGRLPGCGLARLSGSGATCFGLFAAATQADLDQMAAEIRAAHPDWWVAPALLGDVSDWGMPRFS
ncbi:4-(cytidine 5'-diphospho)-2-C-methyl-D-erythritol kinase [Sagittula sp. SSi028]|uniref:4-(cytidine 5'-diphospho)-2-C-methyl-D-erythritol kinase n=1 Tax=Sagittula sp. SSi028 TaxID=3400636 RepID=UPI003AF9FC87